jgi:hypothetical protein
VTCAATANQNFAPSSTIRDFGCVDLTKFGEYSIMQAFAFSLREYALLTVQRDAGEETFLYARR